MELTHDFFAVYQKHYPPSLKDQVWRLEKISKDGTFHTRLASIGIHTIKDFLRKLETDPILLRNVRSFDFLAGYHSFCGAVLVQ